MLGTVVAQQWARHHAQITHVLTSLDLLMVAVAGLSSTAGGTGPGAGSVLALSGWTPGSGFRVCT